MYWWSRNSKTDMEVLSNAPKRQDRCCRLRNLWIWGNGISKLAILLMLMRMTILNPNMHPPLLQTLMLQKRIWWKKNRPTKTRTMYHSVRCIINLENEKMLRTHKASACRNYWIGRIRCRKRTFRTHDTCLCKTKRDRQRVWLFNSSLMIFHKLKYCMSRPRNKLKQWSNKSVLIPSSILTNR